MHFEDTDSYNSFIRIRQEHLKKMGVNSMSVELDLYDVNYRF